MFYSDFLQNPLQNWGFELFFDQFCEIQAYPNLEGIQQNQKTKTKKNKQKPMFETKWGHYWFLDVGCILCQTLFLFFA